VKAKIKASELKEVLDAVSKIAEIATLEIEKDGMATKVVNDSNTIMMSVDIPSSAFEYFEADGGEITINLVRFLDLVSVAGKDDVLCLEIVQHGDKKQLEIGIGQLKYHMALLAPEAARKVPKVPEFDLPALVALGGSEFRHVVKAADRVSDDVGGLVTLGMDDEAFFVHAKDSIEELEFRKPITQLARCKPGGARSTFGLAYLWNMSRASEKSNEVVLEIGIDYPLLMKFDLEGARVKYVLAPVINEEGEGA